LSSLKDSSLGKLLIFFIFFSVSPETENLRRPEVAKKNRSAPGLLPVDTWAYLIWKLVWSCSTTLIQIAADRHTIPFQKSRGSKKKKNKKHLPKKKSVSLSLLS